MWKSSEIRTESEGQRKWEAERVIVVEAIEKWRK